MRNFTVGFAFGLAFFLWNSPDVAVTFAYVIAILLLSTPFLPRSGRLLLLGLFVGALVAQASLYQQLNSQFSSHAAQRDFLIKGTVVSLPKHDSRRVQFLMHIDEYLEQGETPGPELIRLSWYGSSAGKPVRAGDQWQLLVRLKPPTSLGNPGGFHYARWLFHNRIHATGYVRDTPSPKRLRQGRLQLHALRQSVSESVANLPDADNHSALVQGLTVGDTSAISPAQWQTLRHSGTAHLLAISGLHIGLIAGWSYWLAGFFWSLAVRLFNTNASNFCTRPVFSLTCSVVGACTYAALAGFTLPTQRALVMLLVFALCMITRRIIPPGTALLVALLMVLLLDPLTVLSVGFWLSFGTVFALFYLHKGRLNQSGKLRNALSVHAKLGFVLLPATAWFFQQGAMVSPLANLIAVPLVGLCIVPLSFLLLVLMPVWPTAANMVLSLVQWLLSQLLRLLDWLLMLPGANVPLFLPDSQLLYCSLFGLLVLFVPRAISLRWLCVPLLAPALVLNMVGKRVEGLEVHVLDVGQGLSILLLTPKHTVLVDTGSGGGGGATMVERVVQPFLASYGRSDIDISILSHADDDHAGGIDSLISLYPSTQLISSDPQHQKDYGASACKAGEVFVLDEVTFSFLHPAVSDSGSRNHRSCVLLVHIGASRVLLTGDIEFEAEQMLIDRVAQPLPVNALIAPHHGSRSSSTDAFVDLFQPELVVYAAGERNRFQFPHADVVSRYERAGAKGFTTGEGGAVSMRFNRVGLVQPVEQYWGSRRRYRR